MLYFLTKEITGVHDWRAYFIEYVFECYFLWNNVFWDSRIWVPLRAKLDWSISNGAWFSKEFSQYFS